LLERFTLPDRLDRVDFGADFSRLRLLLTRVDRGCFSRVFLTFRLERVLFDLALSLSLLTPISPLLSFNCLSSVLTRFRVLVELVTRLRLLLLLFVTLVLVDRFVRVLFTEVRVRRLVELLDSILRLFRALPRFTAVKRELPLVLFPLERVAEFPDVVLLTAVVP